MSFVKVLLQNRILMQFSLAKLHTDRFHKVESLLEHNSGTQFCKEKKYGAVERNRTLYSNDRISLTQYLQDRTKF